MLIEEQFINYSFKLGRFGKPVGLSCHVPSNSVWRLTVKTLKTVDYFVLLLMSVTQASLTFRRSC